MKTSSKKIVEEETGMATHYTKFVNNGHTYEQWSEVVTTMLKAHRVSLMAFRNGWDQVIISKLENGYLITAVRKVN